MTEDQIQIGPTRDRVRQRPTRNVVLSEIRHLLDTAGMTVAAAIDERDLYFRVSVIGTCNLSCSFCHNEGAPIRGRMSADVVENTIRAAAKIGFTRVQFTGGEPLLNKNLASFISTARRYVDDVGVTTNGMYLQDRLEGLVAAGLQRLHVSLQTEPLILTGGVSEWGVPHWLLPTVERGSRGEFALRFNLPVPAESLSQARGFLHLLTEKGVSVRVFSILPEGALNGETYPLDELQRVVDDVTVANRGSVDAGQVELRGFRPPAGIRCDSCRERDRCMEQSHSLRLGADLVLRPCLATRDWDSPLNMDDVDSSVLEGALLALDYQW